jgi:hypothetical protein
MIYCEFHPERPVIDGLCLSCEFELCQELEEFERTGEPLVYIEHPQQTHPLHKLEEAPLEVVRAIRLLEKVPLTKAQAEKLDSFKLIRDWAISVDLNSPYKDNDGGAIPGDFMAKIILGRSLYELIYNSL